MTDDPPKTNSKSGDYLDALERAERYRLLVEGVQDYAIFMLDTEGTIVTWNSGAQKLKGYSADEIIGSHFSVFYPKEALDRRLPEQELDTAIKRGAVEDNGWRVKKDGSKFWANVVITALHNKNGELIGFAKVTRDLTERRAHEEKLIHANQELQRQRSELQELNRVKDEFVALVSHQLRAPTTAVKQYLGLLLEGYAGDLTDVQRAHIQHAYDSNNRQITMVNDFLHVAQVDAGKVILDKAPTNVVAIVTDVIDEYMDMFKSRKQNVTIRHDKGSVAEIIADKQRLRMAIENLIDNASKYTPHGGYIRVQVNASDSSVRIRIADTGVGINSESIAQLFQKFSRVQNDLSHQVAGNGLGLYWANKIIALHNGYIDVSSQPGKGSVFTIVLPQH